MNTFDLNPQWKWRKERCKILLEFIRSRIKHVDDVSYTNYPIRDGIFIELIEHMTYISKEAPSQLIDLLKV